MYLYKMNLKKDLYLHDVVYNFLSHVVIKYSSFKFKFFKIIHYQTKFYYVFAYQNFYFIKYVSSVILLN